MGRKSNIVYQLSNNCPTYKQNVETIMTLLVSFIAVEHEKKKKKCSTLLLFNFYPYYSTTVSPRLINRPLIRSITSCPTPFEIKY